MSAGPVRWNRPKLRYIYLELEREDAPTLHFSFRHIGRLPIMKVLYPPKACRPALIPPCCLGICLKGRTVAYIYVHFRYLCGFWGIAWWGILVHTQFVVTLCVVSTLLCRWVQWELVLLLSILFLFCSLVLPSETGSATTFVFFIFTLSPVNLLAAMAFLKTLSLAALTQDQWCGFSNFCTVFGPGPGKLLVRCSGNSQTPIVFMSLKNIICIVFLFLLGRTTEAILTINVSYLRSLKV